MSYTRTVKIPGMPLADGTHPRTALAYYANLFGLNIERIDLMSNEDSYLVTVSGYTDWSTQNKDQEGK